MPLVLVAVAAWAYGAEVLLALKVYLTQWDSAVKLPARPAPANLVEAQAQDLADLRMLPSVDRSFSPTDRHAFFAGGDALIPACGQMSPARLWMEVSRLAALSGNGHTGVGLAQRASAFGRVPLRFYWFADGLYVVRATVANAALLGRRVTAIDGRPVDQALAAVRPYFSGTTERAKALSPPLLEAPALLQVIWPDTDGQGLVLATVSDGGDARTDTLAALPATPDRDAGQPIRVLREPAASERTFWQSALSQVPLSLTQPDHVAFAQPLDGGGLYVRINANRDDARGPLADQLAKIAATRPQAGWPWIVLDLRFNDGGDELKTMAFTRALPRLLAPDGQLFVLTGNATFSAAIIIAARARYFVGPARTHIVGEPAGDRARFWTDGGPPLVLRHSGIEIGHAYFLQDWANGCRDLQICHPYALLYSVPGGDLAPETRLGWRFADYRDGRDTVLDWVLSAAKR